MSFCQAPMIQVAGVLISTNDFENARELIETVSGDQGDPTLDGYDENIANGNNENKTTGIQFPAPKQTTPPTPSPVPGEKTDTTEPPKITGIDPSCPVFPTPGVVTDAVYEIQLSPNFNVKSFTLNAYWKNQILNVPGITPEERVCNLKGVAINICEPLLAKFGKFRINSGIRNENTVSKGISQHVTGEAIDIQIPGWTYNQYWENAPWIRDNIPYDQFIFEHSDKTGLAWYHLSFRRSGNRPVKDRTKVMTMYRNHYDTGLVRYG